MRPLRNLIPCFPVLLVAGALALACAPKSPQERVAQIRSFYRVTLNGFFIKSEPIEDAAPAADVEGTEGEAAEEMTDQTEEAMAPDDLTPVDVPMRQDAHLDLLIQHDSKERLPGITVDISMVDGAKVEKGHWRVWLDTADLAQATGRQITYVLDDVDYQEGDGFAVEVRRPVPENELGEYREFATASSAP